MIKKIRNFITREIKDLLNRVFVNTQYTNDLLNQNILQNGKILVEINRNKKINLLKEAEFKVFSQWGDDGIIQYLVNNLEIENEVFVEFGVENYLESNTRFLLMNNNWSGLVLDGSKKNIKQIKNSDYYWKYDLIAKKAFVTADNINGLIKSEGITGNIGLLHIDIDGNDYWIWKAITIIEPMIVIVEYNSIFGFERPITIPYEEGFVRNNAHYSSLYAGSSLLSLCDLAKEKGYDFVGSNSAGNNAYFVKKEYNKISKIINVSDGYVKSKFRESRSKEGTLNYLRGSERLNLIKGLDVFNTRTNKIEKL